MTDFIKQGQFTACNRVWEIKTDPETYTTFNFEMAKANTPPDEDMKHEILKNAYLFALDVRAHGLPESEVQVHVRQFVRAVLDAGGSGIAPDDVPDYGCNAAVRFLARTANAYPQSKAWGLSALVARHGGMTYSAAEREIAAAIDAGLIVERKGEDGEAEHWLAHEPITDAMMRLVREVAEYKQQELGVSVNDMKKAGARILGLGVEKGMVLVARCVNAGLLVLTAKGPTWYESEYCVAPKIMDTLGGTR